jgi:hypothetical protein
MFPTWFTQHDTEFKVALWLLGPLYVWLVKKLCQKIAGWHALNTERGARISLISLRKALENPPTLLESTAYIICALPFPIASAMLIGTLYFVPVRPPVIYQVDPYIMEELMSSLLTGLFFVNYVLFGVLTVHGVTVAYRLREGEARYAKHYKEGVQKLIDRLTDRYPNLR